MDLIGKSFLFVVLFLMHSTNALAMFGINSWNDDRGPSDSGWFGIVIGLVVLFMYLNMAPAQTLAVLSAIGGIGILLGGNILSWFMFIGCGGGAIYVYILNRKKKQLPDAQSS